MLKRTANIEQYTLEVQGSAVQLHVSGFKGTESLSTEFNYTVDVATEDESLDREELLGKLGIVSCLGPDDDDVIRYINGVVHTVTSVGQDDRFAYYTLTLKPKISLLAYRSDCQIFQQKTVKEIITDVMTDAGITSDAYSFALQDEYTVRDYRVQYKETDLEFIKRLLAEEGINYFYSHDEQMHTMVMTDNVGAYDEIVSPSEIIYHVRDSLVSDQDYIYKINYNYQYRTSAVSIDDYDYTKPSVELYAEKDDGSNDDLDIYFYPGKYDKAEDGKKISTLRLESFQRDKLIFSASSDCRRLIPGSRFTLTEHPDVEFNQEYLILSVQHSATQPLVLRDNAPNTPTAYSNAFTCVPIEVPFRPQYPKHKPLMQGIQTAEVVGPAGEEIYTDEFGRIKVQFHWDRLGESNEHSSCWMRVSQTWAGSNWGSIYIPRIGQEVIIDFINGDPDRPIVTGSVYKGSHMPPYTLPEHKTKSAIRSNTSKGGGSYNELLMEDLAGKTQVMLSNAYGHKIIEDEETQTLTVHTRDNHIMRMDDKNKHIFIKTTNAHEIKMDDTHEKGEGTIRVTSTSGHYMQMDDKNHNITTQTKDGHVVLMDDENQKIEVTTTNGHVMVFDDKNKYIGITSTDGHYITIDDAADSITLEDSTNTHRFKIDIAGKKLTIGTDTGSIDILAPSGKIALEAVNIEMKASANIKAEAGQNIQQKAGVQHSIKGTIVKAEAGGPHTLTGMPVKIN